MAQNDWSRVPRGVRARLRTFVFERAGGRCEASVPHECSGRAEEVDHIVPRKQAPHLILEVSNLRAVCAKFNRGRRPVDMTFSRSW